MTWERAAEKKKFVCLWAKVDSNQETENYEVQGTQKLPDRKESEEYSWHAAGLESNQPRME